MSNTADHPAPYAYVSRVTKQSLRSAVLPIAFIAFVWTLSSSVSAFQEISTDRAQQQKKLATLSIVLGSLYVIAATMFLFGVVAAATKRLALIRIFAILCATATVIIIASGFLRTIIHFMLKNSLISECTSLATGQNVVDVWGIWNSDPGHNLTPTEANQFCRNAWSHDSFAEIFWLLAEIIVLPMFTFVAFAYAQQESAGAKGRGRTSLPTNYTPAYGAGSRYAGGGESTIALPEVAYDQPSYAPPPGSPPPFDKSLPGYGAGEMMDKKDTDSMRTAVADDPFSDDFDEYPRLK
jgi:hypothetical protein